MKEFFKDFSMYFKFIFAAMFIGPIAIAIGVAPLLLAFNYSYWFLALYALIIPLYGGAAFTIFDYHENTR